MRSAPLLWFENVSKHRADGTRRVAVLNNACFELGAGVAAGIWGARRSGKTTLLRLAAGIELADEGRVLFDGRDVAAMRPVERERLLRTEIGLVSASNWRPGYRERVVDYVALPLLSTGATLQRATSTARTVLRHLDAIDTAERYGRTLSLDERIRAMLARALVNAPRLLIVDEPAVIPSLSDRDELGELLRMLARRRELALLVASEEMSALRCADFLMSIGGGDLVRSNEQTAEILAFPEAASPTAEHPAR